MNANEISPNVRLNRIQKVSNVFKWIFLAITLLAAIGIVVMARQTVLVFYHLIRPDAGVTLRDYFEVPLVDVGYLAAGAGGWFCYKLFGLYARGELFTPEVVRCIHRVAYSYFLFVFAAFLSWLFYRGYGELKESLNFQGSFNGSFFMGVLKMIYVLFARLFRIVFPGFFLLIITWIMDEGRKIQEEQELTV